MKTKIQESETLLNKYYNLLMDEYNGNASEVAIYKIIEEEFKHFHKNNGVNDNCEICGRDLRNPIHNRI